MNGRSAAVWRLSFMFAASCAVLAAAPFLGMELISPGELRADPEGTAARVFWQLRVPRVFLAYFVGAALACGGAVFQALFRNVLATPFTLGVSSGAACGAALYIHLGAGALYFGISAQVGWAFGGALATVALVYGLAYATRLSGSIALLLAGVVLNFFFSSLMLFLQFIGSYDELFRMTRWLIGSLDVIGMRNVILVIPFTLLAFAVSLRCARALDLLSMGEELARTRGVRVVRVQLVLYAAVSASIAAVVSVCGVVSFVGIMVPCVCRMLLGPRHALLIPASFMGGGMFLTACDLVARTVAAPLELPAGIITALLGGPFFLWLLVLSRRGGLYAPEAA